MSSRDAATKRVPTSIEEFWCWLNTWGDERERVFATRPEQDAYKACISDALKALQSSGVTFETVPRKVWMRWSRAG